MVRTQGRSPNSSDKIQKYLWPRRHPPNNKQLVKQLVNSVWWSRWHVFMEEGESILSGVQQSIIIRELWRVLKNLSKDWKKQKFQEESKASRWQHYFTDCTLCRWVRLHPVKKRGRPTCIWGRGFSSRILENLEFPFIIITPNSILNRNDITS